MSSESVSKICTLYEIFSYCSAILLPIDVNALEDDTFAPKFPGVNTRFERATVLYWLPAMLVSFASFKPAKDNDKYLVSNHF